MSNSFLELAYRKIQKDCDIHQHKLAAIAFTPNGRIIKAEVNRRVLDGRGVSRFSIHAEEYLVRKLIKIRARERFGRINVIVARRSRTKGWAMARPCKGCQRQLSRYGIHGVFYTGHNGNVEKYLVR